MQIMSSANTEKDFFLSNIQGSNFFILYDYITQNYNTVDAQQR